MGCRYCGQEVPLRARFTGASSFCCPEHKKLYHEEHSRIGLARLLEEVSPDTEDEAAPAEPASNEVPIQKIEEAIDPPMPPPISSPANPTTPTQEDKSRSWRSAGFGLSSEPIFKEAMRLDFSPAEYGSDQPHINASAVCEPPPETAPAPAPEPVTKPDYAWKQAPAREEPSKVESVPDPKPAATAVETTAPAEIEFQLGAYKEELPEEEESDSPIKKYSIIALAAVALAVVSYFGIYYTIDKHKADSEIVVSAPEDWIPAWSDGYRGDEIALFAPSQEWSDYLVESLSGPNQEIAWIYRASDAHNYYVVKLGAGGRGLLRLLRYAVVQGEMSNRAETAVTRPTPADHSYKVQLEVRGSEFTLLLEGEPAAGWSDDRLNKGGFGVISKNTDLADLAGVKVIQLGDNTAAIERLLNTVPASSTSGSYNYHPNRPATQ